MDREIVQSRRNSTHLLLFLFYGDGFHNTITETGISNRLYDPINNCKGFTLVGGRKTNHGRASFFFVFGIVIAAAVVVVVEVGSRLEDSAANVVVVRRRRL